MLTEILTDKQLIDLYTSNGYIVYVDYLKKEVKLHTVDCMLADPISKVGIKPSKARENNTGEVWFSDNCEEVIGKGNEIAKDKGYTYVVCPICDR
ncbi:MAG: hypothetical protein JW815_00455 [Candidatus Bathyarchaeota archaeon]|nr:hypothetical protein [Candidatus Bathyarchaeum sp.]